MLEFGRVNERLALWACVVCFTKEASLVNWTGPLSLVVGLKACLRLRKFGRASHAVHSKATAQMISIWSLNSATSVIRICSISRGRK